MKGRRSVSRNRELSQIKLRRFAEGVDKIGFAEGVGKIGFAEGVGKIGIAVSKEREGFVILYVC